MPAKRPCALRKGSLNSKLARVSSKRALKPKLDTASLGESKKLTHYFILKRLLGVAVCAAVGNGQLERKSVGIQ
eukprot:1138883-Pelagomonas_calceolata.AAC.2